MSCLLALVLSCSLSTTDVHFFNYKPLYDEPLAGQRTPETSFSINKQQYKGNRVIYMEGVLGVNLAPLTLKIDNLAIQLGTQAAGWFNLGYKNGAFPLLMEDFYLSVPLSFRWAWLSGVIKYNHISAHLGDGINTLLETTLSPEEKENYKLHQDMASKQNTYLHLQKPLTYSRDFISAHTSLGIRFNTFDFRMYVNLSYVHKMIPSHLGRWAGSVGYEISSRAETARPYIAVDSTYNQDTKSMDYSTQFGIMILPDKPAYFKTRIAFTTFAGYDRRGQMAGRKLERYGVGIFLR